MWWRSGYGAGLAAALSSSDSGQIVNTHAPVTAQSVRSAQNVRQREMSDKTARYVRQNMKCPTKRPEMSDET